MEKLLGTIITVVLIFYILKYVLRLLMPFLMKYLINKKLGGFFSNQHDAFNGRDYQKGSHDSYQDGEVTIQKNTSKKKGSISDELGGEYVDYEEVK